MTILSRTRNGADIYKHIIYKLTGYKMKEYPTLTRPIVCANPWDEGRETLIIKTRKTLNYEIASHHDESGHLRDGDVWDFAKIHYELWGESLMEAINKDMMLHCGEEYDVKSGGYIRQMSERFSYFKSPINNVYPYAVIGLQDIYKAITMTCYKARTEQLRKIHDAQARRIYKSSMFDYCTFGGVFTTRRAQDMKEMSGLMCLDFDHVRSVEELMGLMKTDEKLDVRLLFRSPSGDGVKAIIAHSCTTDREYKQFFEEVCEYMREVYSYDIDKSGSDVSRACFICYDPEAWIKE